MCQLLVKGFQDAWLSGNPQVSFYKSTFKRHVPFGSSVEQFVVPVSGKIVINTKSDLLGYTYLTAHDTTTGALIPSIDWSNVISSVELVIGNQVIATHDLVYINIIQKALEADTYSTRSSTPMFQPLGFFFDKQALPIAALRYTDVKINIIWVSDSVSKQYVYKCWSHCIHLSGEERQFFSTATHRILIPQVQRVMLSNEPNFHGPVKYIAAPCANYANVYISSIPLSEAVTNLQAVSKTALTADITWTAGLYATSYSIVTTPATTTQTTSGTSYTLTGLTDGVNYTVTVTSIGSRGIGGSTTGTVYKNKLFGSAAIINNAPGSYTALSLPGTTGSYAQINTFSASPIGNNLFIEAWVYFNSLSSAQTIFSMGDVNNEYMSIKVADLGGPEIAGPFTCSQTNGDGTVTASSGINVPYTDLALSYVPDLWLEFFLPQPAQYWQTFQFVIYISKQPGTPAMSAPDFFVAADFEFDMEGYGIWTQIATVQLLTGSTTWPAGSYNTTYTWVVPTPPVLTSRNNPTFQTNYRFRLRGVGTDGVTVYTLQDLLYSAQVVPSGTYNNFKAQANQWNHIAFTWSDDFKTLSSFCNGMWVKTVNQTASAPLFSSRSSVGASNAGTATPFNGYIRNLRIIQGGSPPFGDANNLYTNPNFVPDNTFTSGVPDYVLGGGTNVYTLIPFPTN